MNKEEEKEKQAHAYFKGSVICFFVFSALFLFFLFVFQQAGQIIIIPSFSIVRDIHIVDIFGTLSFFSMISFFTYFIVFVDYI